MIIHIQESIHNDHSELSDKDEVIEAIRSAKGIIEVTETDY